MTVPRWRVERLVPGGEGFLRLPDGRAAFVPGGLPGDALEVLEIDEKKSYVRALRYRLVEPGPLRVVPACAVAESCGGCDWMALEPRAQLQHKAELIKEALRRTGGFDVSDLEVLVERAGPDLGYRTRLRVHVDEDGRVGLYSRHTHSLVELAACPVSGAGVNGGLELLQRARDHHAAGLAACKEIEIRQAPAGAALTLHLLPRSAESEPAPEVVALAKSLRRHANVVIGREPDTAEQLYPLPGGLQLHASAAVFTQVNWRVNLRLVGRVVDGALSRQVKSFCDLYCGAGNFSLPLMHAGLGGVGIERSRAAVRAAKQSADEAGLNSRAFTSGDVRRELTRLLGGGRRFELFVVDAPRSGAREVLPAIARAAPRWVAFVACDPVTLARDLKSLCAAGYQLDHVQGFDMFPHTHHVEVLAWLRRGEAARTPQQNPDPRA